MRASSARAPGALRFAVAGGGLVLLEPSHDVPLVTIVVALRCGSSTDPGDLSGLSRIAVRMLRRGCEGLSSEQIDFRIDALGAEMAVDTSPSTVAIHAQVIARNLDPFVDLLARMLSTSTFPLPELERLKRESAAEIVEARDNDRAVAQKAFQRTMFEGHPYGRSAGGTLDTVSRVDADHVKRFITGYLVRENIVVGLAGDVASDRAPEIGERLLSGLPRGRAAEDATLDPTMTAGRRLLVVDKPERTQTQLLLATLGTSPHDDDHVELVVANAVFGGTFTSRLMSEIRSKRGWAYGASSRTAVDRRRQAWVLGTAPAATDAGPCLRLCVELVDAWVSGGVTPREVKFIQRYLVRSYAFDVDTSAKRLHQALDVELLGLPPDYYASWVDRVRAVTAESATEAVRRRIHTSDMLAVVVGTASEVLEPLEFAIPSLRETIVVPFDAE